MASETHIFRFCAARPRLDVRLDHLISLLYFGETQRDGHFLTEIQKSQNGGIPRTRRGETIISQQFRAREENERRKKEGLEMCGSARLGQRSS